MNIINDKFTTPLINFINKEDNSWIKYLQCNYEPAINIEFKYTNPFSIFIDFMIEKSFYEYKKIILPLSKKHKHIFEVKQFYTCLNSSLVESLTTLITPTLTIEYNTMQNVKRSWEDNIIEKNEAFASLLSCNDYKLLILKTNPILLDNLASMTTHYINTYIELYSRLTTDYLELINTFGKLGKLIHISCNDEDMHNTTDTIKLCHFENNSIVYISWSRQENNSIHKLTDLCLDQANNNNKQSSIIKKTNYGYREYQ
jgi:lantibiotic modifying enzyme